MSLAKEKLSPGISEKKFFEYVSMVLSVRLSDIPLIEFRNITEIGRKWL